MMTDAGTGFWGGILSIMPTRKSITYIMHIRITPDTIATVKTSKNETNHNKVTVMMCNDHG